MHLNLNKSKRILIVSFYFAPSPQVGGKRFTFLSRILQKRYPELHILTVKEKYISPKDDSLDFAGIVHRTGMYPSYPIDKTSRLKKVLNRLWNDYLCIVDPFSGWILPALIKGLKVIKNNRIDLIIATGPPFSSMVVGFLLSIMTNNKLIIDYRDPWTVHRTQYSKIFGKKINRLCERLAIGRASALVFCSSIMKEEFITGLGNYTRATYHVVPNGFHDKNTLQPVPLGNGRKNIVYAGSLYGERRLKLLASPLFHLLNEGLITKETFCLHIFGKLNDQDRNQIMKYRLQDMFEQHPQVPYAEILKYLRAADILFLPSGSDVSYAIPFKFYDYLSVKRPILAVAPKNSAIAELMNKIDCGKLALINSEKSILKKLRTMLSEDREYSFSGAERYTWHEIARKYMQVIDAVS